MRWAKELSSTESTDSRLNLGTKNRRDGLVCEIGTSSAEAEGFRIHLADELKFTDLSGDAGPEWVWKGANCEHLLQLLSKTSFSCSAPFTHQSVGFSYLKVFLRNVWDPFHLLACVETDYTAYPWV